MNGKLGSLAATAALTLALAAVGACSKGGAEVGTEGSVQPGTSAAPAAADGPLGRYDPPIEVSTVRSVNAGVKFKDGDSYDNNVWSRDFASKLGIRLTNKWKVSDQQYPNKITVTMVSGDLPDFMTVDAQQFQVLVQAGQLADLTDVYNRYASEWSKRSMNAGNGIALKAATVNGKIMSIPVGGGGQDDAQMIYIRNDWLRNVGLLPPKTMDDVYEIALAFAKNDPDRNGKNDTYGLSVDLNMWNGWSGLDGFFNGYHAYPFNPTKGSGTNLMFLKGADGKAVWADTQPEVKTALGKLQELFHEGAIYPEFSVIDGIKSAELVTSGKVGMTFGAFWVPSWPINSMKKNNKDVDWGMYPLVSADGKPVLAQSTQGLPNSFLVVSRKAKHPEAVFKMMNYFMEKVYGDNRDESYHVVNAGEGLVYNVFMYSPVGGGFPETNQNTFYAVQDAIKNNGPSKLNPTDRKAYDDVMKYRSGDLGSWQFDRMWGEGGAFDILGQYKKSNRILPSAYTGSPTPTMISRGPSLRDMEAKTFTEIIMGVQKLDAFDDFAKKWQEQGGNDILAEVNASGQLQ
ncbi:MAG: extracellular solute-binding protein [Paenibacillaceae bacterium]|nr:extracellular solute-binding protein [Paenibacillaceae bacterium]